MSRLRVGIIGSGGISHSHAPNWVGIGAEVFVYSLVGGSELAERYGLTLVDNFERLLSLVDVVDVCTPTPTHREIALAAIAAGKDVLCEKPLGHTTEDALVVTAAARAAGVQLYPAHVVRYFPEYVALQQAVRDGRIGQPAVLRFSRGGEGPSTDWFYDDARSGGIVFDQMIHDLDQARWIAGEVTRVYAVQNPPTVDSVIPRNVVAQAILTHESGAISYVQGVWGPRGMAFGTSFSVAGDAGMLTFDSLHQALHGGVVIENLPGSVRESSYLPPAALEESPYLSEIREFAVAFGGGPAPRVSAEDGVIAVALAEAARESIAVGEPVEFRSPLIVSGAE